MDTGKISSTSCIFTAMRFTFSLQDNLNLPATEMQRSIVSKVRKTLAPLVQVAAYLKQI